MFNSKKLLTINFSPNFPQTLGKFLLTFVDKNYPQISATFYSFLFLMVYDKRNTNRFYKNITYFKIFDIYLQEIRKNPNI